jgi:hypothetical protein
MDSLLARIKDLEDLCKWLDKPMGDNRPIFATQWIDPEGNRHVLEDGVRMEAIYHTVFGDKRFVPGMWMECPTCGMVHVDKTAQGPAPKDFSETA